MFNENDTYSEKELEDLDEDFENFFQNAPRNIFGLRQYLHTMSKKTDRAYKILDDESDLLEKKIRKDLEPVLEMIAESKAKGDQSAVSRLEEIERKNLKALEILKESKRGREDGRKSKSMVMGFLGSASDFSLSFLSMCSFSGTAIESSDVTMKIK